MGWKCAVAESKILLPFAARAVAPLTAEGPASSAVHIRRTRTQNPNPKAEPQRCSSRRI